MYSFQSPSAVCSMYSLQSPSAVCSMYSFQSPSAVCSLYSFQSPFNGRLLIIDTYSLAFRLTVFKYKYFAELWWGWWRKTLVYFSLSPCKTNVLWQLICVIVNKTNWCEILGYHSGDFYICLLLVVRACSLVNTCLNLEKPAASSFRAKWC